jgi:hypothetical protein
MTSATVVPASRWVRRWWPLVAFAALVAAVLAFVALGWRVQLGARDFADEVRLEFPGDRVEALAAYIESDRHTLSEKNHAVWALGQLRDPRGLPVLLKHRTGRPCDHARFLCQHEIDKAVAPCRGDGTRGWFLELLKLPVEH